MKELICITCPRGCHLTVDEAHDRDTARLGRGQFAAAGNSLVVTLKGMGGNGRRIVFRPHHLTAKDFSLQLEIKHNRHTIGTVEFGDFRQALIQLVAVLQDFLCVITHQLAGVNAGKGHPGHTLGRLMVLADSRIWGINRSSRASKSPS